MCDKHLTMVALPNTIRPHLRRIRLVDQDAALSRRRSGVRTPYAALHVPEFPITVCSPSGFRIFRNLRDFRSLKKSWGVLPKGMDLEMLA